MKKGVLKNVFAVLILLPVYANATIVKDFNENGTIQTGDYYDQVNIWNDAFINMTGGQASSCYVNDAATLNYTNGTIWWLVALENSTVNINSDYTPDFELRDDSKIFLYKGAPSFQVLIFDNAQLHIYGKNLVYTPYYGYYTGFLDGYWDNGHSFHIIVRQTPEPFPQNNIILHEIPEPGTFSMLGVLVLIVRKRGN